MIADLEQRSYLHLRRQILNGTLRPGQRVSEVDVARDLNISRTPVRHAIRQLEADGLIKQAARSGTYIRSLTEQEMYELWQVREAMEVMTAGIAAGKIGRGDLAELEEQIEIFRAVAERTAKLRSQELDRNDCERLIKADAMFHTIIVRASGNSRFIKLFADLHLMANLFLQPAYKHMPANAVKEVARLYRDHARIFRAIKQGDAEAARKWMGISIGDWSTPSSRENLISEGFYYGEWSKDLREWLIALDEQIAR